MENSKKFPLLAVIGIIAAVAIIGYAVVSATNTNQASPSDGQPQESQPMTDEDTAMESEDEIADELMESDDQEMTVSVEGGNFYFKPNEIIAKRGEEVKIVFFAKEGMHDFVIDEFNVKTERTNGGETTEVIFTPNSTGTFEFYCSVGNHRAMGMKGTLIVE